MVGIIVPVALFVTLAVIIIGLPIARAWAKRMEHHPTAPPQLANTEVLGRLERIEQSLEVMSTEIERITEGQRFVTRLLSESHKTPAVQAAAAPAALPASAAQSAPANESTTTPHPEDGTILSDSVRRP